MRTQTRRRWIVLAVVVDLIVVAAVVGWVASAPPGLPSLPEHVVDVTNGERLFHAGSCLACHWPGPGAATSDPTLPAGGAAFETPAGTFYPQNLTPDRETGLAAWSPAEFVRAMKQGVSPRGQHYFPAFPYTSYRAMTTEDVLDLHAYLTTLRPVRSQAPPPSVPAPWLARRAVGLWKRIALRHPPQGLEASGVAVSRRKGEYLVRAPGHCGECHTPRNALMILDVSEQRYLAGAAHPAGEGRVPSLRGLVARGRYADAADLALALQYGEELGFDRMSSGGMGLIQTSLSRMPESDLQAMAEYLVSLE